MQRSRTLLAAFTVAFFAGCTGTVAIDDDDTATPQDDDSADEGRYEETFIQVADPTDILFVVDNSCSMQEEQNALMANFWSFMQVLMDSGLDYHIGVTVLDDWEGQQPIGELLGVPPFIDEHTEDPLGVFSATVAAIGTEGLGQCEVGLEASYRALSDPLASGINAGFYRDEARLTVVIVSDEPDCSTSNDCDAITWPEYVPWLTAMKGASGLDKIFFAAIAGDLPEGCTSSWGNAEPGHGYWDVYSALGDDHASYFSICEHDWSPVMSELGQQAASMQTSFPLSRIPLPQSLEVFVDPDGEEGPDDEFPIYEDETYTQPYAYLYDPDTNALEFDETTRPGLGARLRVTYEAVGE